MRALTELTDWAKEATKKKLLVAEKIRSMNDDKWARLTTTWIPYQYVKKRKQGHPRPRWRDELSKKIGQHWWNATTISSQQIIPPASLRNQVEPTQHSGATASTSSGAVDKKVTSEHVAQVAANKKPPQQDPLLPVDLAQKVPKVPLDIIASHVVREEKVPQTAEAVPSSSTAGTPTLPLTATETSSPLPPLTATKNTSPPPLTATGNVPPLPSTATETSSPPPLTVTGNVHPLPSTTTETSSPPPLAAAGSVPPLPSTATETSSAPPLNAAGNVPPLPSTATETSSVPPLNAAGNVPPLPSTGTETSSAPPLNTAGNVPPLPSTGTETSPLPQTATGNAPPLPSAATETSSPPPLTATGNAPSLPSTATETSSPPPLTATGNVPPLSSTATETSSPAPSTAAETSPKSSPTSTGTHPSPPVLPVDASSGQPVVPADVADKVPSTKEENVPAQPTNSNVPDPGSIMGKLDEIPPADSGDAEKATVTLPTPTSSQNTEYCTREECPESSSEKSAQTAPEGQLKENTVEKLTHGEQLVGTSFDPKVLEMTSGGCGLIGDFLKSLVGGVRSAAFLSGVDDAGVGLFLNFLFLLVVVVIHFTSYFMSDLSDAAAFDGMSVFFLLNYSFSKPSLQDFLLD
ncbi:hypothetical protein Y032_0714g1757 [Ancylostoma ceylanicum]|uniref:Uncharacterized protein n=1 Tax=Ancylostoma ceylanicum TaxID=53326 RepID=A0A016WHH9_9BILA|nr:hypothetical protein Y032_0714g1757 [Ancylostoma ceylanicum]